MSLKLYVTYFQLKHSELVEAAYNEELSNRIDEITKLSNEVVALKGTIDELLLNNSKTKFGRQDSSLEFEALKEVNKDQTPLGSYDESAEAIIQQDLMSELKNYDEKLKEKDKEILLIDQSLKEKEQNIERLNQILNFNTQFFVEIQAMNKMIEKKMKGGKAKHSKAPSRDECIDGPTFEESLEPETFQELSQVQTVHKLKENIEQILRDCLGAKVNKRIGEGDFEEIDGNVSPIMMEKKSLLKQQEERIKQAFLENEAAEKETKIKLQTSWDSTKQVEVAVPSSEQEEKTSLIETGVESLSEKIVESLIRTLSLDGSPVKSHPTILKTWSLDDSLIKTSDHTTSKVHEIN